MHTEEVITVPVSDIIALSRAAQSVMSTGVDDIYVDISQGCAELKDRRGGSYGARTW